MPEEPSIVPLVPPRPRPGKVLAGHVAFVLLNALLFANAIWVLPLLVRLHFGSADPDLRDWQTTLITAAVPTFMMLSVFWHEVLRRLGVRRYLVLLWLVSVLPLGCLALVHSYAQLLACHIIATAGFAGWAPLNGKLLQDLYPAAVRGRVYGLLNVVMLGAGSAAVWGVGRWLEVDPEAFRTYFPAAAVLQLVGVAILMMLSRRTPAMTAAPAESAHPWKALLRPVLHMGAVLRADRTFQRYERAYMTYGAAFMLCDALLPVLATARLDMRYEDYAQFTQVTSRLAMLVMVLPMGWLLDRIGAVRTSGIAFAILALFPLLLMRAGSTWDVGAASLVWGVGLAGVQIGWLLGPVTLAPTPDKVPQYVAIHATLVGVRGILFQGLGMLLYKLTGTFVWPLAVAAVAFAWAAVQMRQLHRATLAGGAPLTAGAVQPD